MVVQRCFQRNGTHPPGWEQVPIVHGHVCSARNLPCWQRPVRLRTLCQTHSRNWSAFRKCYNVQNCRLHLLMRYSGDSSGCCLSWRGKKALHLLSNGQERFPRYCRWFLPNRMIHGKRRSTRRNLSKDFHEPQVGIIPPRPWAGEM